MKLKVILAAAITLIFNNQVVMAGTIGDTYTTGELLTTTTLDNIKTAVNGNALDITTNASNITILQAFPHSWSESGSDIYFNSGNIGIGVIDPLHLLHIQNSNPSTTDINPLLYLHNRSNTTDANAGIFFGNSSIGSYVKQAIFAKYSNGLWGVGELHFAVDGNSDSSIVSANDSKMMISQTGNVGIRTTVPSVALEVVGSIEYTGTITDVSDERLKDNILPIKNALEKIKTINGVSYNMIDTPDKREIGVIAQNVQSVLPEAVSVVDPENGYLGVSYPIMIPVLIEAIKEQQKQIEELKSQLSLLQ